MYMYVCMIYVYIIFYIDNTHVYSIYIVYTYMSIYIYINIYIQSLRPSVWEFFELPYRASLEVCCPGIIKTPPAEKENLPVHDDEPSQKLTVQLILLKNCHFQVPSRWFLEVFFFYWLVLGVSPAYFHLQQRKSFQNRTRTP